MAAVAALLPGVEALYARWTDEGVLTASAEMLFSVIYRCKGDIGDVLPGLTRVLLPSLIHVPLPDTVHVLTKHVENLGGGVGSTLF